MLRSTLASLTEGENLQFEKLNVRFYNSELELAQEAAKVAQKYLASLLAVQKTVSIILATGNSQRQFLSLLASECEIDWSRVILFHLDEYLGVGKEQPTSFYHYLQAEIGSKVSPLQFHFIDGEALEPLSECDRYIKLLQQQPIDLCLLGIGDNGHLAFNEPGVANFNDPYPMKLVRLEAKTRQQQVNGGYFTALETVPQYAYTLTIPTICSAKKIFCLAPGINKKEVVQKTLQQEISSQFPATILRTQPQAVLFCQAIDLS